MSDFKKCPTCGTTTNSPGYWMHSCILVIRGQRDKALEELDDWLEGAKRVMSEDCPTDEKHCACVPTLRRELAKVTQGDSR